MFLRDSLLTPADRAEENGTPLREVKPATPERKAAQPGPGARLFPRKVQGLQANSPQALQEAYQQLERAINELEKLPETIKSKLKLPDKNTLNFAAIHYGLERSIIDEECWRKIKGLALFASIFFGGQLAFRSLMGGIVWAIREFNSNPWETPSQAFECGWEISKWPALIFSCWGGTEAGYGYGSTESTTEEKLKCLQKEIDRWVSHIRSVEAALQNPGPQATIREDERITPDHQTAPTVPNQTEQDLSRSVLLPRGLCR